MSARSRTAAATKAASRKAPAKTTPAKTAPRRPTKAAAAGAAAVADAAAKIVGGARPAGAKPKPAAGRPATGELRELPLTVVIPSPDNPRSVLEDLDLLARSIQLRGVLEPVVVTERADGDGFDLVMGHRRHAAAALAGLKTIPAIVRPAATADGDREALIDRMVENLQRRDLAPVDEARGYARLKSLGLTQDAISKAVGRNAGHVSKYLKLLTLPEPLQTRVGATDGITIEQGVDVARLPGEVQVAIAEATHADDDKRWAAASFDSTARSVAARARRDASRLEAIGRARKAKTSLLNVDGDDVAAPPAYDRTDGPAPLGWIYPAHRAGWEKAWTAHAKLPCHAAVVRAHPIYEAGDDDNAVRSWIEFVCTDPTSHVDEPTTVPAEPGTPVLPRQPGRGVGAAVAAPVDAELEARREATGVALAARRVFVTNLFGGKLPAGAVNHVVGGQLRDELLGAEYYDAPDLAIAADFLTVTSASDVKSLQDVIRAAAEATRLTGDPLLRWALAVRLAAEEAVTMSAVGSPHASVAERVIAAGYLEFLETAGHELHALERELVFDAPTVEDALIDADVLEAVPAGEPVDWRAVQLDAGVTEEALANAAVAGVPYTVWLRSGVKTPTGRCRVCAGDAKALTGGRAGKHKADGAVCSGGGQQLLTVAEVRDADAASDPDGVDLVACSTCEGVGRVGDHDDLCPDCAGRGLVAPAPAAAVAG